MSAIAIYQTLFGSMFHFAADQCIGASLKIYGQWALDEIALLYKIMAESERGDFIDLGANVGTHTVAIGRLFPQREIYSFEAQEKIFRLLSANTVINGLMNTRLSNCLIGDTTKLASFVSNANLVESNSGAVQFRVLDDSESAPSAGLIMQAAVDDIFPQDRHVACIKVDLEGMEFPGLLGTQRTIDRCMPVIYFEQNADKVNKPLFEYLTEEGYQLYWHANFPFDPENFKGGVVNIFGPTIEKNVLCLPESNPLVRWLAKQLVPVTEAYSGDVQSACAALNGQFRRELKRAVPQNLSSDFASDAYKQLQIDFRVLRDDRILAQRIMETQLAEINYLKKDHDKQLRNLRDA